jgi:hypothetical protein
MRTSTTEAYTDENTKPKANLAAAPGWAAFKNELLSPAYGFFIPKMQCLFFTTSTSGLYPNSPKIAW